jgi:hypothetical protein
VVGGGITKGVVGQWKPLAFAWRKIEHYRSFEQKHDHSDCHLEVCLLGEGGGQRPRKQTVVLL